jgi:signal transduction histidine kinase
LRYGFAAVMAALAVAVRLPFHELLQNAVPFLFFFPAIMASAWFGGLGPGLLTTAISAVLADFLYLSPAYAWSFTLLDFIQIALFLAVGSVISGLSEALHAARRRVTIDLSDRAHLLARAEEARFEAEAANRAKDEFLATLSHELRTPLNAILGWAEMLLLKSSDPALLERGLTSISRSARAQAQLIEDLLDVSGIISGKMRLDARPIELAPVVEAALESVRPAALAKEIRLQRVFAPLGAVHGDPDRLQQVVWNLLANAVKFTPKGGEVQVRVRRVDAHAEILVADSGVGIAPDLLPHVFERFRQADSSTRRQYGGLGLGLAIVRHLVELHGGTVEARSAGEGKGAAFTVSLPLNPLSGSL